LKKANNYICKLNTGEELSSGWQDNFFHAEEYIWIVGNCRKLTFITKMFRNWGWGIRFWVQGFGFMVQGWRFRVQGGRFKVPGSRLMESLREIFFKTGRSTQKLTTSRSTKGSREPEYILPCWIFDAQ